MAKFGQKHPIFSNLENPKKQQKSPYFAKLKKQLKSPFFAKIFEPIKTAKIAYFYPFFNY